VRKRKIPPGTSTDGNKGTESVLSIVRTNWTKKGKGRVCAWPAAVKTGFDQTLSPLHKSTKGETSVKKD